MFELPNDPLLLDCSSLEHPTDEGLTARLGAYFSEALNHIVQTSGHQHPTDFEIWNDKVFQGRLIWQHPEERCAASWADTQELTEKAACGFAILLIKSCGWKVVGRSRKGTGFDYWIAREGQPSEDFQNAWRLEVSGIQNGTPYDVKKRLAEKLKQTKQSDNSTVTPAVAVVAEFGKPVLCVGSRCKQ